MREIGPGEAERLGNAQARTVEKRQDGGVAGCDPRFFGKLFAGRNHAPRIRRGQRLGQRFRLFRRAQCHRARRIHQPAPFQETQQRAHTGQPAPQSAGAGAFIAAQGEETTKIGRAQRRDIGDARRTAAMAGQKLQELAGVALLGFHRQRRQPALAGQCLQAAFASGLEVRFGGDEEFLHWQNRPD